MAARICRLLPPHTVYVEPFCGSAAVMFQKGLPEITNNDNYREVLNDTNGQVVNFFRVMQDEALRSALIDRLEWTLYSQDEHKKAKEICKASADNTVNDPVTMAWAWFVNISCSFANKLNSGFGTANYNYEPATTFYKKVQALKEFRDRLKCTTIMNEPALKVIERFDSPQTVFYVDPPYPGTEQGHYGGFTQADFVELVERLKQCHGAVVLSCYHNEAVPSDWVKHEFHAVASSAGITGKNRGISAPTDRAKDRRIECVWVKQASSPMREKLVPIAKRNYETLRINFEDFEYPA